MDDRSDRARTTGQAGLRTARGVRTGRFARERQQASSLEVLEGTSGGPRTRPHCQEAPPPPPPPGVVVVQERVDRVQMPRSVVAGMFVANLVPLALIGMGVGLLLSKRPDPQQGKVLHSSSRTPARRHIG